MPRIQKITAIVTLGMCVAAYGTDDARAWLHKEFRDWSIICGNGLTCSLETGVPGEGALRAISFERTNEPASLVSMSVSVDADQFGEPESLTLAVGDDARLVLDFTQAEDAFDGWKWQFPATAEIAGFLQAVKSGDTMSAELSGTEATDQATVSLAGVTAGLLFIDETQDRVDRDDALQATGDRAVPDVAPVSAIQSIGELPVSIRSDFDTDDAYCGGLDDDRFALLEAFRLRGGEYGDDLIGVPCGLGGAYNQPYTLYQGSEDRFRPVSFPVMADEGPSTASSVYNLSYDPSSKRLTSFFKGRGIGDCGFYNAWRIVEGEPEGALVLTEARSKGDCDGDYAGGPENWPVSWPENE